MKRACAVLFLVVAGGWVPVASDLALPNRSISLKFAGIGDNGTGEPPEYEVARP